MEDKPSQQTQSKEDEEVTSNIVDISETLFKLRNERATKAFAEELSKSLEISQAAWKTTQVSFRDMEIRFLEELKEDLAKYTKDFLLLYNTLQTKKTVLDRKVLWKHLKLISEKIDAIKRGIEIKKRNIGKMAD